MPKDFLSADLRNKAGITTKPFLVNLTFWEDRPRLNFWEKILLKRKQLAKQAKNEAKEEEISAYMAEVSILRLGPGQPRGLPNFRTSNMFHTSLRNCLRTVRRLLLLYKTVICGDFFNDKLSFSKL